MRFTTFFAALGLLSLTVLTHASALPNPSPLIIARSPAPSHALEARAPQPSVTKRGPRVKRKQTPLTPEEEMSRYLCPSGMSVCPFSSNAHKTAPLVPTSLLTWIEEGFECTYLDSDVNSCGGCGSVNAHHDCTTIPNALSMSCVEGACRVRTCKPGFILAADGRTCVVRSL